MAYGQRARKAVYAQAARSSWHTYSASTERHALQAAILFDKFHVLRHLSEALDGVRRYEYARFARKDRTFIKGQKYALLSNWDNLSRDGRRNLEVLFAANKRLNRAYLLKESFGQLWVYHREGWARRFFDNWRAALKWQRLEPFEKFADMIDRHWDGIAQHWEKETLPFVPIMQFKVKKGSVPFCR